MALPQPQQYHFPRFAVLFSVFFSVALFSLCSCKHESKTYTSDCDMDISFKKVSFEQLVDSIKNYDQQYVEVSGKYEEDKELSALFSNGLTSGPDNTALWVNFSQDCPLYQTGTHKGLFEYNDGQFTQINDQAITIRGLINIGNKGHGKKFKATIERISLVRL